MCAPPRQVARIQVARIIVDEHPHGRNRVTAKENLLRTGISELTETSLPTVATVLFSSRLCRKARDESAQSRVTSRSFAKIDSAPS